LNVSLAVLKCAGLLLMSNCDRSEDTQGALTGRRIRTRTREKSEGPGMTEQIQRIALKYPALDDFLLTGDKRI